MRKLLIVTIAGLFFCGGSVAFAAPKAKTTREDAFKKLDANNDGKLDLTEFKAKKGNTEAAFKALDTNNDGSLSADEFKARGGKKGANKDAPAKKKTKKPA